ncbi:MAG TPA: fibronectin type III domain-containing protein [Chthoniobacteraceae bacterium]|nr:fibronectin type III domain-containing protein [Chthoniobacteraceae bacterium]
MTQSGGTLTGLISGQRHYVRLRAIGPLGPGPWSDEPSKMVP